jgi:tetratricopeptide (TPR) repeat protein
MPSIPGVRYDNRYVKPAISGVFLGLVLVLMNAAEARAQTGVTFTKDVAPILFAHCVTCHRPGDIGPFSLLTYQEARPWAAAIARAARTRTMPPWKPEPGYGGEFVGARRLSGADIETLERWASGGGVEGDPADLPAKPALTDGWQLGQPDLIVSLPEPLTVPPGTSDVLRNVILPVPAAPSGAARYVRGIEFRPGNRRVVHHANIRIDRTGASRALDESDPAPGFDGRLTGTSEFPDGHFLGWTPGQIPPLLPDDMAWPLDARAEFVVQLHLQPTDRPETVQPSIGVFFSREPASLLPIMLRLGRQNIDIAAGAANYVVEDRYVLPVDVEVHAVQPHAHFRAREIRGVATLPDGREEGLLYIKDWDFNWQDVYRYIRPIALPKGTTVRMRFTYDNSAANRRNPDRPPKRVRWGQKSTDEMGDLWLQVVPRTREDRRILAADFGPKVLAEDAVGYEKMLETDPDNATLHEAAGVIHLSLGRIDRATRHLREAVRISRRSASARYNLATALLRERQPAEARALLEEALQIDPDHVAAHVNLGAVLRAENDFEGAARHLRRALEIDPASAAAHTNLAGILAAEGALPDAIRHYRLALQSNPNQLEALTDLAWLLAAAPDASLRVPAEAIALATRAVELTSRGNIRALETLAAAQASAGQRPEAIATQQAAIRLAEVAGNVQLAQQLREQLALYRK